MTTIFELLNRTFKNKNGYEEINRKSQHIDKEDVERISIARSRRNIREIALSNNFEFFVTLTLNSSSCDKFSLSSCQEKLRKTLKAYKRKNKDFAYLLITEKHKDGAFHFHGLMKGINNSDLIEFKEGSGYQIPYKILDYIRNGLPIYKLNYFDDKLGYCTLSKIHDYAKCCNYICKYITKDCIKNEARDCLYIFQRSKKSY